MVFLYLFFAVVILERENALFKNGGYLSDA